MTDYSEKQMEELAQLMPKILRALRTGKGAHRVLAKLDEWCWHTPACLPGETCIAGVSRTVEELNAADTGRE